MSNSAFPQSQSPYASELNAGLVQAATEQQLNDSEDTSSEGAPLFVPPSEIVNFFGAARNVTLPVVQSFDGTAVPVALAPVQEGGVAKATGSSVAALNKLIGFSKENKIGLQSRFEYINTTNSTTVPINVPAGENLVLIIIVSEYNSLQTLPSFVNFDGNPAVAEATFNWVTHSGLRIYRYYLGTVVTPYTADMTRDGNTSGTICAIYSATDQVDFTIASGQISGSGIITVPLVNPNSDFQTVLAVTNTGNSVTITNNDVINRGNSGGATGATLWEMEGIGTTNVVGSSTGVTSGILALMLRKTPKTPETTQVQHSGVIGGFTGLVPGAAYYLSNTNGLISITPGTVSVPVGVAISATELLIKSKL